MKSMQRVPKAFDLVVLAGFAFAGTFGNAATAIAQDLADIKTPDTPLVLKSQGSFFVGGEAAFQNTTELGAGTEGHVTINQMYVEFMVPLGNLKVPVVLVHGGALTGRSFDTTPDGRMGWKEYFVRKGHPVYIPDQVSRARSGFDQALYNNVRAGITPPSALPNIARLGDEFSWTGFRFGPAPGVPFSDTQFPVEAAAKFSAQGVPDLNLGLPPENPTTKALSDLAIQAKGAVLMGHSQGAIFPMQAALLNPTGIKGVVSLDSNGLCSTIDTLTDQDIGKLLSIPILIQYGDHLDTPAPAAPYLLFLSKCQAFVERLNAAGGNATMMYLPEMGIRGNTHMMMFDRNNLQIADLIMKWIGDNIGSPDVPPKNQAPSGPPPAPPAPPRR